MSAITWAQTTVLDVEVLVPNILTPKWIRETHLNLGFRFAHWLLKRVNICRPLLIA